jgi:hypothetical protein
MGLVHVMEFPSNAERDYLNLSICSVHAKFLAGVHDQRGRDLAVSRPARRVDPVGSTPCPPESARPRT